VRDSEGAEGWVLHSLLSGRRTAIVGVGKSAQTFPMLAKPQNGSDLAANLQSGVIVNIKTCDGSWCAVDAEGVRGFMEQVRLWGVYPGEKVE